jgi:hypothetical protein
LFYIYDDPAMTLADEPWYDPLNDEDTQLIGMLWNHRSRTLDPDEADFFVIAFPLMMNQRMFHPEMKHKFPNRALVQRTRSGFAVRFARFEAKLLASPHFRRNQGRDHFIPLHSYIFDLHDGGWRVLLWPESFPSDVLEHVTVSRAESYPIHKAKHSQFNCSSSMPIHWSLKTKVQSYSGHQFVMPYLATPNFYREILGRVSSPNEAAQSVKRWLKSRPHMFFYQVWMVCCWCSWFELLFGPAHSTHSEVFSLILLVVVVVVVVGAVRVEPRDQRVEAPCSDTGLSNTPTNFQAR